MRIAIAVVLLTILAGWATCRPQDTGYRVKVVVASGTDKLLQAKFVVLPDDLRLVCHGDPKGMDVGDYVKVEVKNGKWMVGKMECGEIAWVH